MTSWRTGCAGDWENPNNAQHFECGKMIGTRSANFHGASGPCSPRKQAGHMSALTPCRNVKKPFAPQGPSHMGNTASLWHYDAAADQALRPDSLRWSCDLALRSAGAGRCPSLWRCGNDKLSGHLDLRLDGVRNEAVSFDGFHDLTGGLKFGFALDRYKGTNSHFGEAIFAVDVLQ